MLELTLRLALAALLAGAALMKLSAPAVGRDALSTFGLRSPGLRSVVFAVVIAAELALAVGVGLGSDPAAAAAAALMLAFAAGLALALRRGLAGAPCGCLGARSRVSGAAVVRNLGLAAAFVGVLVLPDSDHTTEQWLGAGLVLALAGIGALTVGLLALAREVGELRMGAQPQAALELDHEGPELGSRSGLAERFAPGPDARVALAVFTSEGCSICAALAPSVELLRRDRLVAVEVFDEVRDADAWAALDVPGSPYAVALDPSGTVLAKGTFNTLPQLESVIATANRRREAVRA